MAEVHSCARAGSGGNDEIPSPVHGRIFEDVQKARNALHHEGIGSCGDEVLLNLGEVAVVRHNGVIECCGETRNLEPFCHSGHPCDIDLNIVHSILNNENRSTLPC